MRSNIHVFGSVEETVQQLAAKMYALALNDDSEYFHLAISGGSTPLKWFKHLSAQYASLMPWSRFKVFWVDERCVPPDDSESNYGMARHHLLRHVGIPEDQVYRIRGEYDPYSEADRYASLLQENLPAKNGSPLFDLIVLGMGDDGHTASVFPGQIHLFDSEKLCEVAAHPETGQKRITLTGKAINNAHNVVFLVTGGQKAPVLNQIIDDNKQDLPASLVSPDHGVLEWYLDASAAKNLKSIKN